MQRPDHSRERGSTLVEFALTSLIWVPLLLGSIVFGFNILSAIQVSQLSRDSGHMYAYGVDFTQPQNAALLQRLASSLNLNIQPTSGTGNIVFSKITLVSDNDCKAAGLSDCANTGKYVFTDLFVFGNQAGIKTALGSPTANFFKSGSIKISDYLTNLSLVATKFPDLGITFTPDKGQYAYVAEVNYHSTAVNWNGFTNIGSYARSIF